MGIVLSGHQGQSAQAQWWGGSGLDGIIFGGIHTASDSIIMTSSTTTLTTSASRTSGTLGKTPPLFVIINFLSGG
jgi:hypothetical protein